MTIIYEINPPKIPRNSFPNEEQTKSLLSKQRERVTHVSSKCDGIHITESVLGTSRISAIIAGKIFRSEHPDLQITVSMRVIDKDMDSAEKYVQDVIAAGLDGILVLKGDPSQDNPQDSGLVPSKVVKDLKEKGYDEKIKLFLSLPSKPNFDKISKKVDARPVGFMTQVIHSTEEVSRICKELKPQGFKIIPCILLPSEKNATSAKFLNLDWSSYQDRSEEFIKEIHQLAGDVLITSPNDFTFAKNILDKI